jgi:uncharacterized protein YabN with tetrapyrrole methylase and pyrophosphatase domain
MPTPKSKRKTSKRRSPSPTKPASRVGPAFEKLVAVMSRLRAPSGCPWDREQTHATLRTYLIEEAYEVLDALDSTDDSKFAEELGDLLLQILFHAQIAHEEGRFDISHVIAEIHGKMIRRHPHVFGETSAKDAAEVLRNWEIIKSEERQAKLGNAPVGQGEFSSPAASSSHTKAASPRKSASPAPSSSSSTSSASPTSFASSSDSLLDGVPRSLPALLEAFQLTRKAARIGFDWHNLDGIFAKLQEETHELQAALAQHNAASLASSAPVAQGKPASPVSSSSSSSSVESELGDLLFVAVNLARFLNLDPEIALKKSSAKFSRRFREMERLARSQGTTLAQVPRPEMESFWDQAKQSEQRKTTK